MIRLQQTGRGEFVHDQSQLPGQVVRILQARVHTLSTRGRVHIGGVPCKEDATLVDIVLRVAFVDPVAYKTKVLDNSEFRLGSVFLIDWWAVLFTHQRRANIKGFVWCAPLKTSIVFVSNTRGYIEILYSCLALTHLVTLATSLIHVNLHAKDGGCREEEGKGKDGTIFNSQTKQTISIISLCGSTDPTSSPLKWK